MRAYKRLTRSERYYIYVWYYEQKITLRQIALRLHRTPKTVYDEVHNNRRRPDVPLDKFPYDPEYANWLAAQNRINRRYGKLQTSRGALKRVQKAIEEKHWSIPMIAHSMKNVPSTATLYHYLHIGVTALKSYQKRKYHLPPKSMRDIMRSNAESDFMKQHSIDVRPETIQKRRTFGHWEMDCIDSPQGTNASLLVFYERKSRYIEIMKVDNKRSTQMHDAIQHFLERHSKQVHSITTDRGHEFTNFDVMSLLIDHHIKIYFAHAYCPEEKGGIERINRDIRRFFPKGQSFTKVTLVALRAVQDIINHYPRAVLQWKTPQMCYHQFLNSQKFRQKATKQTPRLA